MAACLLGNPRPQLVIGKIDEIASLRGGTTVPLNRPFTRETGALLLVSWHVTQAAASSSGRE